MDRRSEPSTQRPRTPSNAIGGPMDTTHLDTLANTAVHNDGSRPQPSFRLSGSKRSHDRASYVVESQTAPTSMDNWYHTNGSAAQLMSPSRGAGGSFVIPDERFTSPAKRTWSEHDYQSPSQNFNMVPHPAQRARYSPEREHRPRSPYSAYSRSTNNDMAGQVMYLVPQHQTPNRQQAPSMYMMPPSNVSPAAQPSPMHGGYTLTQVHGSMQSPSESQSQQNSIDDHELLMAIARRNRNRNVKVDEDTVTWLKANFEIKAGCTVPRNLVYKAYKAHMQNMLQEPCNAAGFGKTLRSVFPIVTSRRLGSRGNSRYHYDGLRIKPSSAVAMLKLVDDDDDEDDKKSNPKTPNPKPATPDDCASSEPKVGAASSTPAQKSKSPKPKPGPPAPGTLMMLAHAVDKQLDLPEFPQLTLADIELDGNQEHPILENITEDSIQAFSTAYRQACLLMLNSVKNVNFGHCYAMIHSFWKELPNALKPLTQVPSVCSKIELWDTILYDTMVHVLLPEVLRPIGKNATGAIENFADDLCSSIAALKDATLELPSHLIQAKNSAAKVFMQIMKRRMALNSVAQAGQKMLTSQTQMELMREDLRRADLDAIRRESAWVTGCNDALIEQVLMELKSFFEAPRGLSFASHWLVSIVDRVFDEAMQEVNAEAEEDLKARATKNAQQSQEESSEKAPESDKQDGDCQSSVSSGGEFAEQQALKRIQAFHRAARSLLQSWTYYSVQILRDLTIRSAPSFGSFNVLRILFDEYMFYLVQTRVTHPQKVIRHPDVIVRVDGSDASSAIHRMESGSDGWASQLSAQTRQNQFASPSSKSSATTQEWSPQQNRASYILQS